MNDNKTKIKRVFIPYLIISLVTLITSTYLHWLLFIKFKLYEINEGLVLIIPLVLSVTLFFIWLDKRLDVLIKKSNADDFFYFISSMIAMVGLSFFIQQYVALTIGKVTNLSSISQIKKKEPTKFYTLKNFYLDKNHFSIKKQFKFTGRSLKYQSSLDMSIYITIPILNSVKDTLGSNCKGWYGIQYIDEVLGFGEDHNMKVFEKDISLDTIENSVEVKKFINESMVKFDKLDVDQFLYFERISKTDEDYNNYVSAIKNNTKYDVKSDVVLLPYKESIADRANENLLYALAVFVGGSLLFLIMVINAKLKLRDDVSK